MIASFDTAGYKEKIFNAPGEADFSKLAIDVFHYQAKHIAVYKEFLELLKIDPPDITRLHQIPFLPVTLFKTRVVKDDNNTSAFFFSSSGTTGAETSKHFVNDLELYRSSFMAGFELFYGAPSQYCILGLLPSYLERPGSSLVYMVNALIGASGHPHSGFYLDNYDALANTLQMLHKNGDKILLLGVTFALLDLFEKYKLNIPGAIIMETGGMKGRRREMIRQELHDLLKKNSGVSQIHSEYGMTELLSQAYAIADGFYNTPPWMKIVIRDINDPFSTVAAGQSGMINIIDLANLHSCAFLATQDLGRMLPDGSFEVLGRADYSEMRGCSLMV